VPLIPIKGVDLNRVSGKGVTFIVWLYEKKKTERREMRRDVFFMD
jgi:hypothetical protein